MPLKYNNKGTRRLKLAEDLESILSSIADKYKYTISVTSGGQNARTGKVGSDRHNEGHAADVDIFDASGKQLIPTNKEDQKVLAPFLTDLVKGGITSIGAGAGYMGGTRFHIDNAIKYKQGKSGARYWGQAGKAANAPDWLKAAVDAGYGDAETPVDPKVYAPTPYNTTMQELPLGTGYQVQNEEYTPVSTPQQITGSKGEVDYSLYNTYGWIDGNPIKTEGVERKGKAEAEKQKFNLLLDSVKNPTLKSALATAFGIVTSHNNWLDNTPSEDKTQESDYQNTRRAQRANKRFSETSSSSGTNSKREQGGWLNNINTTGYLSGSPTEDNDYNIIPSGSITMENVSFPVVGTDNTGHTKLMMPGENYQFPGNIVIEKPIKNWLNTLS